MRHQLGYLISEAMRGLRTDRLVSATAVLTVGLCASILALALAVGALAMRLTERDPSQALLRVYLSQEAEDAGSVARVEAQLGALSGIDSLRFVSKEQALEEFRRDFGPEMIDAVGANPLPPSFMVWPSESYATATRNAHLRGRLARISGVEEVSDNARHLEWLDRWKGYAIAAAALLGLFLSGALTLVVHNAVKLSLYARRQVVENMLYCGAGEWFIATPFLLEGFLIGTAGSLIGVASLAALRTSLEAVLPGWGTAIPFWILSIVLAIGCGTVACVASLRTVHLFIREGAV